MKDSKVLLCVAGFFLMVLVSLIVYPTWVMDVVLFIGKYQWFFLGFLLLWRFYIIRKNNSEIA